MLSVLVSFVAAVFHVLIPAATAQTSSKYRLVPQKITYEAARLHCRSEYGTDLASIHNTADNDEAKNLCATAGDSCWFGLTDLAQENVFVWEDGTAFDYGTDVSGGVYPWHSSQPDDGQRDAPFDSEECCELRVGFEYNWNDDQCSATKYFICNMDAIPAPTRTPFWSNMQWAWAPWVSIALCVLCCACSAYGFYYYRKKKDMSERDRHEVIEVAREMPTAAEPLPVPLNAVQVQTPPPVPSAVLQPLPTPSNRTTTVVHVYANPTKGDLVSILSKPLPPQPVPPLQPPAHMRSDSRASESGDEDSSLTCDSDLTTCTTRATGQEQIKQAPLDASQYAAWTSDEVVRWIVDINYEAHKQYDARLRAAFAADIVNGKAMSGVSEGYLRQCGVGDVHCRVILQNIYQVICRHGAELSLELEEEEQAEDEEEGEGEVNTGTAQEPEDRTDNL